MGLTIRAILNFACLANILLFVEEGIVCTSRHNHTGIILSQKVIISTISTLYLLINFVAGNAIRYLNRAMIA